MSDQIFLACCGIAIVAFGHTVYAQDFSAISSLQAEQFAHQQNSASRFDLNVNWKNDSTTRELHLFSFYESGKNGDWSVDSDQTVLRIETSSASHFWMGRAHPLIEAGQQSIQPTSALGSQWVQNQSDALHPRVAGWVGAGLHQTFRSIHVDFAASPLFLPSFSPAAQLVPDHPPTGARYARLPPSQVNLDGTLLPLHYDIQPGPLTSLLMQPQVFAKLGFVPEAKPSLSFLAWSAPQPDPDVEVTGKVRVSDTEAHVLATVVPHFPRRTYNGILTQLPLGTSNIEMQVLHEWSQNKWVFSFSNAVNKTLAMGFLHSLANLPPSPILSANYAERLGWAEWHPVYGHWLPLLRIEHHFTRGCEDLWLRPSLQYATLSNWSFFVHADLLAGTDQSYYGAWRHLGAVSIGGSYLW